MRRDGYRVGIDFGTSMTVAVLQWPDGHVKPLLFDGSPLLPSAVAAVAGQGLLVGRDALHAALPAPERFEPHPKRRIDDGTVLLGEDAVPVVDLVAAVLERVAVEARRVVGAEPDEVVLTYPAGWGARRRSILRAAARGLPGVRLVPEPVAAASYLVAVHESEVPAGAPVVVYDFGAGTFDATVVRRGPDGFEVLASRGLDDAGGLDIDAALVAHLGTVYATRDPALWRRLTQPVSAVDRRAALQLWDHVRTAKEALSRLSATTVHVPLFDDGAPIGREQLDALAALVVDRTVAATRTVMLDAGVDPADLAALFLVGGASRLPLAATALHRTFGTAPIVLEQPELVVAEGSLLAGPEELPPGEPVTAVTEVVTEIAPEIVAANAAPPVAAPGPGTRGSRLRRAALVGAAALLVVLVAVLLVRWRLINDPTNQAATTPSSGLSTRATTATTAPGSALPPSSAAPQPSANASRTSGSGPAAPVVAGAVPGCADSDLSLVVAPEQPVQYRGAYLKLTIKIKNISGAECTRDLGADMQELYLQAGATKVWSSDACDPPHGSQATPLRPTIEVSFSTTWNGRATSGGCENRATPPAGEYQLFGRLGTKVSAPAQLRLTD